MNTSMFSNRTIRSSISVALAGLFVASCAQAYAQGVVAGDAASNSYTSRNATAAYGSDASQHSPASLFFSYRSAAPDDPRAAATQELHDLKKKLRDAAEGQRKQVTAEMKTALEEYFDRDMEYRRRELDRLKKRADDTQSRNEKRQSLRSELIDLQLQSFMHDAEGLGLFEQGGHTGQVGNVFWQNPVVAAAGTKTRYIRRGSGVQPRQQQVDERQTAMDRITKARSDLAAAEDADAESEPLEELKAALEQYFDADMAFRRAELERVREGLSNMEARLEKRVDAKSQIVELQLKMMVNEADGLGFFSGGESHGVWPEAGQWWKQWKGSPPQGIFRPTSPAATPRPDVKPRRR